MSATNLLAQAQSRPGIAQIVEAALSQPESALDHADLNRTMHG